MDKKKMLLVKKHWLSAKSQKAQVLSFEAVLGVIVFTMFFSVASNSFFFQSQELFSKAQMKKISVDALDILDETDALEGLDKNTMSTKLGRMLPSQLYWKMNVSQYRLQNQSFSETNSFSFGDTNASISGKSVAKTKRVFLTFSGNKIDRFNYAELWVWLK